MKEKVIRKQPNSKKCFVCGLENHSGLNASFYEMNNKCLVGIFSPLEDHQGYPGRLHGGLAGTLLDETMGRSIMIEDENFWGVTIDLSLKFRKPVPLDKEIKVIARMISNTSRIFEAEGEIRLENGEVAISGTGKYMKLALEKITNAEDLTDHWKIVHSDNEPIEIDI
jgi:acyl-coenzyme A thioesterase PaaI-like protein